MLHHINGMQVPLTFNIQGIEASRKSLHLNKKLTMKSNDSEKAPAAIHPGFCPVTVLMINQNIRKLI